MLCIMLHGFSKLKHFLLSIKCANLGLAVVLSAFVFFINLSIAGPMIQADEGSYLANASAIAGYHNDFASSYHAGYSLLIAPAFLIADNPQDIWTIVKIINALLYFMMVLLLSRAAILIKPDISNYQRLSAVALVSMYPMWVVFVGYSFSQIAFVPFFLIVYVLYYRSFQTAKEDGHYYSFINGFFAGYLYWIHPTGIAVVLALFLGVGYLTWFDRKYFKCLVALFISTLFMIAIYKFAFTPWLFSIMTISEIDPRLHYPSLTKMLSTLLCIEGLIAFVTKFGGMLFYLSIGSVGLFWVGVIEHNAKNKPETHAPENPNRYFNHSLFIFSAFSILGILGLSALLFASPSEQRLDYFIYGRYVESVIIPFLLMGALSLSYRKVLWAIAISTVCAILLWKGLETYVLINYFNISAFWQAFLMPEKSVWLWLFSGIFFIILVAIIPRYMGILLIASIFLFSSFKQINWHDANAKHAILRWNSALLVREIYPKNTTVGFDHSGIDTPFKDVKWFDIGFVLFDYDLMRVDTEYWYDSIDGPLFSYDSALYTTYPEVNLISVTQSGGPYLWAKNNSDITLFKTMIWYEVMPDSARTDLLLGSGWHFVEKEHVWSSQEAVIQVKSLWFGVDEFPEQIVLKINAFGASPTRPVDVIFDIGSNQVKYVFDTSLVEEVAIPLGNGEYDMKILVTIPLANSPSELIDTDDKRVLGVGLHSFQFR